MRLSESRTRALSKQVARELVQRGAVVLKSPEYALADLITRVLNNDQNIESQIEAEAREAISRHKNLPPPGSGEYQAAFERARKAAAARRGLPS